jgi:chemotaxis protein MotB
VAKSKTGEPSPIIIVKKADGGHKAHHGGSWKVAYADFVTAMMAFFLLLWLLATLKPEQKNELSLVFQDKNVPTKEKVVNLEKMPSFMAKDAKVGRPEFKLSQENKLKYEVALMIKEMITNDPNLRQNSGVSSDDAGVRLNVNSPVLFDVNSATLKPGGDKILDGIVEVLKAHKLDLVVRGHADDGDSGGGAYPSKWELSSARAAAIVRHIVEKGGIPPTRVRAVGYGDSQPLVPPTSPDARAKNRRVEFYYHGQDTPAW